MARQGEDVAAVDKDDAYKNLAKTLNVLLERLEKMKTGNLSSFFYYIILYGIGFCRLYMYCIDAIQPFGCNTTINFISFHFKLHCFVSALDKQYLHACA